MAQRVIVSLTDDLDGSEATQTVHFGIDGSSYEIDLSDDNADELRDLLDKFRKAGRKLHGIRGSSSSNGTVHSRGPSPMSGQKQGISMDERRAIQAYAKKNKLKRVGDKGMVARHIVDQWTAAGRPGI